MPEPARIHHAHAPILFPLRDVPPGRDLKPQGLWYGLGEAWVEWCRVEEPTWIDGARRYTVELNGARVLRLKTPTDVRRLTQEYAIHLEQRAPYEDEARAPFEYNLEGEPIGFRHHVPIIGLDWERVAEHYDGIEVAPYHQELRFSPTLIWYYGWDCESGCIWRAGKVTLR